MAADTEPAPSELDTAAASLTLARVLVNIVVLVVGILANSLVLAAILRFRHRLLLPSVRLGSILLLLFVCLDGSAIVRLALTSLYIARNDVYTCQSFDCSVRVIQSLGSLHYIFVTFVLCGHALLALERYCKLLKNHDITIPQAATCLSLATLFSLVFTVFFTIAPPESPFLPQLKSWFSAIFMVAYLVVVLFVSVVYFTIYRSVRRNTRVNIFLPLESSDEFVVHRGEVIPGKSTEDFEKNALHMAVATTLAIVICYAPSAIYNCLYGMMGLYSVWLDFISAVALDIDVVLFPVVVLYFQPTLLECVFEFACRLFESVRKR
ncbi:hypothetical protein HDU83_005264 [Entophlyctis luteolus]|nr:hypothetical protein HDU83_005264 [Entophlyctis luteolus]KAJ3381631.1 hypothetical protein HDU84_004976 [Entophlyctis sp. JEL0112]